MGRLPSEGRGMKQMLYWSLAVFVLTFSVGLAFLDWRKNGEDVEMKPDVSSRAENTLARTRVTFPIEIPSSWRIDVEGKESGGWRQTGVAPGGLEDIENDVGAIMASHGFSESRRIAGDEIDDGRKLIQYESPSGIRVLWMLWDAGGNKTGFSWGREK